MRNTKRSVEVPSPPDIEVRLVYCEKKVCYYNKCMDAPSVFLVPWGTGLGFGFACSYSDSIVKGL